MRIPALVLLLVLAVGIPALRYAIRTPAGSTQTAARNSAPATPTAPASHATALAQTAPAANPPAQPAAGNANPATQAQQQAAVATSGAATSAALTPGSGTPAAETAQTTNTTVVEVHAGKDKPVNATDLSAASQQAMQPAQAGQNAQAAQATQSADATQGEQATQPADAAQAAPSEPQVAQVPPRAAVPPSVRTPAPMRPVRVRFQVLPWGEVYVDGVRRGVSPPFHTANLSPGTHRIEIRNGSLTPYVRTVTLDAGSPPLDISYKFE